jgi:hypothetical protein
MGASTKPEGEGNAGGGAPAPSNANRSPDPEVRYVNLNAAAIIARHGNADAAIMHLARENKKERDRRREAIAERDRALEAAKLKPGEIKLAGEDAKKWEAITKLGKTPAELEIVLKEHGELRGKVTASEQRTRVGTAAKVAKFNEDALASLVEDKKLNLVLVKEQVDGKDVEIPYIKPATEGAAPIKLTEYVDKHLAVYKPALLAPASAGNAGDGTSSVRDATGEARRTPYPEQSAGNTGNRSDATSPTVAQPVPGVQARVLPSQRAAAPDAAKK